MRPREVCEQLRFCIAALLLDFNLEILEKTSKVLDFHNKEKIVRIFLKLVDNLKDVPVCEEHMSDILQTAESQTNGRRHADEM